MQSKTFYLMLNKLHMSICIENDHAGMISIIKQSIIAGLHSTTLYYITH